MVLLYDINTNQTIMEESNIKDNYTILYTATILITKYSCDSYCSSTAAHMQVNKYSTGMYTKEHKVQVAYEAAIIDTCHGFCFAITC